MSMVLTIPEKLKSILDGTEYLGETENVKRNVETILNENDEFFPNYTEHGMKHVQKVLACAEALIAGDTFSRLDAKTVSVLVMAVLVHDVGMFIHYGGLRVLLKKPDWGKRWEDYRRELAHMSGSRAEELFGKYPGGEGSRFSLPSAAEIAGSDEKLIDRDWTKRLCGEFLRRNHHEIAGYCVINGFPVSPESEGFSLLNGVFEYSSVKKAVALIARCHGESMETNERLAGELCSSYDPGYYSGIPVYFLMALIRLADYLDAGGERAPWLRLPLVGNSPKLSETEFAWNQFIENMRWEPERENIHVTVAEEFRGNRITSTVFQRAEKWLSGVQQGLDESWRYISIMYGGLNTHYALSVRRILSNISDPAVRKGFGDSIVLKPASLSAAPEILGLLTEPLYGDHPTYGVRELLQNAVDACRERKALTGDGYKGEVLVNVVTGTDKPSITFTDNGVGMTEDVILNYFLKAGSSYRQSDEWEEKYGESGVTRTGRFGIGVLAAFLLGESVTVVTLPMGAERGFVFTVTRDEYRPIDISRAGLENEKIRELRDRGGGTAVSIALHKRAVESLVRSRNERKSINYPNNAIKWYLLDDPSVVYRFDGREWEAASPKVHWFDFDTGDPRVELKWSEDYFGPRAIYNGFAVGNINYPLGVIRKAKWPSGPQIVLVSDRENVLQINISRDVLHLPIKYIRELKMEYMKLSIAKAMMAVTKDKKGFPIAFIEQFLPAYSNSSGIMTENLLGRGMLFSNKGCLPLLPCLVDSLQDKFVLIDIQLNSDIRSLPDDVCFSFIDSSYEPNYMIDYVSTESQNMCDVLCLRKRVEKRGQRKQWKEYNERGLMIYPASRRDYRFPPEVVDLLFDTKAKLVIHIRESLENNTRLTEGELRVIREYFGLDSGNDGWIPFDPAERRKKFPRCFDPADSMFQYIKYLSENNQNGLYYTLEQIMGEEDN